MQSGEYTIDVGLREPTEDLLQRLVALPTGARVRLNVPRDAVTLRTLDDFNMLRDLQRKQQLQLTVASHERTITGLARIYGFEFVDLNAARRASVPVEAQGDEALPRPARAPYRSEEAQAIVLPTGTEGAARPMPTAPPAATGGPAIVARAPQAPPAAPPAAPRPATTGAATGPAITENDWIFNGVVPADTMDLDLSAPISPERSPVPPPDVTVPAAGQPPAPAGAPSPATPARAAMADADDLGDLANLNFDAAELDARAAEYEREVAARPGALDETAPGEVAAGGRTFVDRTQPSSAVRVAGGTAPAPTRATRDSGRRSRTERPATRDAARPAATATATTAGAATGSTAGAATAGTAPAPATPATRSRGATAPVVIPPLGSARRADQRDNRGLIALGGVLLIVIGLIVFLWLGLQNTVTPPVPVISATVNIVPKTTGAFGPVSVDVPVMTTGSASRGGPGLAAPVFPLTDTLPLTPTAAISGTAPITATVPATGTTAGPRTAQPLQALKVTATLHADLVISTTGVQTVPDQSAIGTIEFTNTGANAVRVPANTGLIATNGRKFHTVQAITVPATDFIGQVFGTARVDVQADAPGPDYNGASIGGSYSSTVFATVRRPGGGSTKQIRVVAAADRDALLRKLKADIDAHASSALDAQIKAAGPDMRPLTCTMVLPADVTATQYTVDPAPNTPATQIHGVMTATASVYTFNIAQARHQAALAAQDAAPTDLPVQAQIDPASLKESTLGLYPVGGCSNGRVQFNAQVSGTLVYTFPPASEIQDQIRTLVAGKTADEATTAILNSPLGPYIDQVTINVSKDTVLSPAEPIPTNLNNIQVSVAGNAPAPAAQGTAGPPALSPAASPPPDLAPTATSEPK